MFISEYLEMLKSMIKELKDALTAIGLELIIGKARVLNPENQHIKIRE